MKHDVIVPGTGLASLRAALAIAQRLGDAVDIVLVTNRRCIDGTGIHRRG